MVAPSINIRKKEQTLGVRWYKVSKYSESYYPNTLGYLTKQSIFYYCFVKLNLYSLDSYFHKKENSIRVTFWAYSPILHSFAPYGVRAAQLENDFGERTKHDYLCPFWVSPLQSQHVSTFYTFSALLRENHLVDGCDVYLIQRQSYRKHIWPHT